MKKLLYFAVALSIGSMIYACSDDHGNFGNYNVKSELIVLDVVSDATGEVFPITISQLVDTVFVTKVVVRDTTFAEDGSEIINVDTVRMPKKEKTTYYYANDVVLPAAGTTYTINIQSNATWKAPAAIRTSGANWLQNDGVTAGGGDGCLNYHTLENSTANQRPYPFTLNVYSSDSTVWYNIKFQQLGTTN